MSRGFFVRLCLTVTKHLLYLVLPMVISIDSANDFIVINDTVIFSFFKNHLLFFAPTEYFGNSRA